MEEFESVEQEAERLLKGLRSSLELAVARARSLKNSHGRSLYDIERDLGAPSIPMVDVLNHMGDLLFFWPPFWEHLRRFASAARNPRGPRDLSLRVQELRATGWSEEEAQRQMRRESGTSQVELSNRARRQISALLSALISRRGGWKERRYYGTFFDQWKGLQPADRSAWVKAKAKEAGISPASVQRYVGKGREVREGKTHRRGRKRKITTPTD
jgi:hypothetical protein